MSKNIKEYGTETNLQQKIETSEENSSKQIRLTLSPEIPEIYKYPYWPSNSKLKVKKFYKSTITLKWTPAKDLDGIRQYQVYQDGKSIAFVDGDVYSYEVKNLKPIKNYTFKVEAENTKGYWSTKGPSVTVIFLKEKIVQKPSRGVDLF